MPFIRFTAALTALLLPAAGLAADLTVEINGVESSEGQLIVCLWETKTGFPLCPKDAPNRLILDAVDGASAIFPNLEPGPYAVSAFHDKDGNGTLKQNFIGIPKEPAAVSGQKQKRMGPPKFKGAVVDVAADVRVVLVYE